ncbi:CubicO group peptidase (beta-lactamase class C family) [Winogradskyella wandonensis]|uniref:CubicO group peptidase (Beta-lactamase class C family) n=1 Tax=Winogradskyella wandonensis TaxID=1442586 RepID=A0A4V2PU75_9FLAO|nr:serine hydrolase [Winogradskyella wandonensis]TCK69401.1 CubicO group peptidase (beta-lactamase class C family) [Winogradskyella wandonensis]
MKRIILLLLLIPLIGNSQNKNETTRNEKLDYFIALTDSLRTNLGIPGVGLVIVNDNKVIYNEGLGYSNITPKTPVTKNTLFTIGSNTKAFTGVLIAKLVANGKMKWDDPLKKYVPELDLKEDYIENNVTIADALSHATGLERNDALWKYKNISRDSLLASLKNLDFVADFRSSYVYNNLMFTVAGIAAERATGKAWESLITSEILSPLGMNDTYTYFDEFITHKNKSIGYKADGLTPEPPVITTAIAPAGAISSTPKDMSKWLLMLVNDGKHNNTSFLMPESYNYIMSPHKRISIRNKDELWYYYAGLGGFSKNGNRNIGHSGAIDGQNSKLIIRPDNGFGIVVMTNKISDYKDLIADYAQEWFIEGTVTRQYEKEYGLEAINHAYVIKTLLDAGKENDAKDYFKNIDKVKLGLHLEANINALGYIFLNEEKIEESVFLFELNTQSFPNSANAFDSLGEALLKKGDKTEAKKAYKKSLELNPNNDNARKVLKSLE